MGIGKLTIPLFLSALPEGMTFTVDAINEDTPPGFWSHLNMGDLRTFKSSDIAQGRPDNKCGAKVAELALATGGSGFGGGQGGSFLINFTIKGRPNDHPDALVQDIKGTLTIGSSEWGFFSRPDQVNFMWQIGDKHCTYTSNVTTLSYLDDSCIAVAYVPESRSYVFGVTNQQDFIVKVMQGAVSGIITGHKALWSTAAGMVTSIGGVIFGVVVFGAGQIDGI